MSKRHKEAVQKQFTKTAEAFAEFAVRDSAEILVEKVEFIRPQADDYALDVACGPGSLVLALAPRVRFARGVDLTRDLLEYARRFQAERGLSNVAFEQGDAEQLPYPAVSFDLVTCQCSLHHMPKPRCVLEEMVRVAKPEARLAVIDTLAPESDEKFELHNDIEILRDPSHTATLRLTTFLEIFDTLGLEITRQSFKRRERSFNQWMLRAGLEAKHKRYQETRKLMEDSIAGDRAGFSPHPDGEDLRIVHNEGMFLLTKKQPE